MTHRTNVSSCQVALEAKEADHVIEEAQELWQKGEDQNHAQNADQKHEEEGGIAASARAKPHFGGVSVLFGYVEMSG